MSTNTAAYCEARKRLPLEYIKLAAKAISNLAQKAARERGAKNIICKGRVVKIADGFLVNLMDTPENQAAFPQDSRQEVGSGFPIIRMVGLFCLDSGCLIDVAEAPIRGKRTGENALLRKILHHVKPGEVLILDAIYSNYFLLEYCLKNGIDFVMERHGSRDSDYRTGKKLGSMDHLITYLKPKKKPDWMSQQEYDESADSITVRETQSSYKKDDNTVKPINIVTSFCNVEEFSREEIGEFYGLRWTGETNIGTIKTTMQLAHVKAKTPEMAMKVIWMTVAAYNNQRRLMMEAGIKYDEPPKNIAFKHAMTALTTRSARLTVSTNLNDIEWFHREISSRLVADRPGRSEPRMVKGRPKARALLIGKRHEQKERLILAREGKKLRSPDIYVWAA